MKSNKELHIDKVVGILTSKLEKEVNIIENNNINEEVILSKKRTYNNLKDIYKILSSYGQ